MFQIIYVGIITSVSNTVLTGSKIKYSSAFGKKKTKEINVIS